MISDQMTFSAVFFHFHFHIRFSHQILTFSCVYILFSIVCSRTADYILGEKKPQGEERITRSWRRTNGCTFRSRDHSWFCPRVLAFLPYSQFPSRFLTLFLPLGESAHSMLLSWEVSSLVLLYNEDVVMVDERKKRCWNEMKAGDE